MPVRTACLGVPLLDPLCQGVGSTGSSLVGSGASAILDSMASWVADGSTWLLHQIGQTLSATTSVSIRTPWFLTQFKAMEGLLALVALPMLLFAAIQALTAQRPGILLRAALVQLPLAMVLAGGAVQLAQMALALTDELCRSVSAAQPGALQGVTSSLAAALSAGHASGSAMPSFILLLLAAFAVLAGIVLWVELLLRSSAIYLCLLFLPLALACSLWPVLSSWVRRLTEVLISLILSKLVVVVALCAAAGALGTSSGRGVATVMTGIALLALACFAPFTLLRMLPLFESSAALHLEGVRQRATGSMTRGAVARGASMAMTAVRAGSAPPLAPSLLAAAASDPLQPSGTSTSQSPMDFSAIRANREPGPAPVTPPGSSGQGEPHVIPASEPTRWPGGNHEPAAPRVTPHAGSPADRPPRAHTPPPLVIERDHLGPLIRPRRDPEDV